MAAVALVITSVYKMYMSILENLQMQFFIQIHFSCWKKLERAMESLVMFKNLISLLKTFQAVMASKVIFSCHTYI